MFFTMSDEARLKAFKWGFVTVLAVWALLLMSDPAHACLLYTSPSPREFKSLYELVSGWARGYLGRAIAVVFLLVGLLTGLVRGSVVAAVTAMGAAVALLMLPAIIDTLFNGVGV